LGEVTNAMSHVTTTLLTTPTTIDDWPRGPSTVLYSAPPIPAGILSFLWNSSGIPVECTGMHRNAQNSTGIQLESSRIR